MALVAYALARPRTPLVVWFHSEVIRPRWQYRLFYEPLLDLALRRAARIIVASPPMHDVPALAAIATSAPWCRSASIPSGYGPRRVAVDAIRAGRSRRCSSSARLVATRAWTCCCARWPACRHRSCIVGDGPLARLARGAGPRARRRTTVCASWVGVSDDERLDWYRARRRVRAAVGHAPGSLRHGAGRGDAVRPAGRQHRAPHRRALGQPARRDRGWWCRPATPRRWRPRSRRLCQDPALRARLGQGALARARESLHAPSGCATVFRRAVPMRQPSAGRPRARDPARPGGRLDARAKRALDVALSGAGLLASAPLWALIAAAHQARGRRAGVLRQERSGPATAQPFQVWKFRSMIPDAEARDRRRPGHRARSARHARRAPAAGDGDGRTAAALEHLPRRHELHGPARAAAGRDRGARRRRDGTARGRARLRARARACCPG